MQTSKRSGVIERAALVVLLALVVGALTSACGSQGGRSAEMSAGTAGATGAESALAPGGLTFTGLPSAAVARLGSPVWATGGPVKALAVTDTGTILSCTGRHVRLWDSHGTLLWSENTEAGQRAECALSGDGRLVVLALEGSPSSSIRVIDWRSGRETDLRSGEIWVQSVATSKDGARVLVAGANELVVHEPESQRRPAGARILAFEAAFAPDGSVIAIARDKVLRWSAKRDDQHVATVWSTSKHRSSASISADASRVAWVSNNEISIVDVTTGIATPLAVAPDADVYAVALSPKGDLIAIGTKATLSVWEVAGPKKLWHAEVTYPRAAFTPDGTKLVYADAFQIKTADARVGSVSPNLPTPRFLGWAGATGAIARFKHDDRRWAVDLATREPAKVVDTEDPAGLPYWAEERLDRPGVGVWTPRRVGRGPGYADVAGAGGL